MRNIKPPIISDLKEKMVFISGPRQVGKTTLALEILRGNQSHPAYLNWDSDKDRIKIMHQEFPVDEPLLIFDEIHKFKRWRNYLKGLYDKTKHEKKYLVTGSARLDLYRRGGDSLFGRYHFYRLHPLVPNEIEKSISRQTIETLIKLGGFPEPFYSGSERVLKRWHRNRMIQVLRDDLRDLERIEEIDLVFRLAERLPALVGSPLSINALREDLQVAHFSVQRWLIVLEKLFYIYRISPYGAPKIRAVRKEQKTYLWDWSQILDPGARFENYVGSLLLAYCDYLEDTEGERMELRYIRDTDKREVDFVVIKNGAPLFAVECRLSDTSVNPHIHYFQQRTSIPYFYQVHMGQKHYQPKALPIEVIPIDKFASKVLKFG
ncbi:MAG: ATP-binding protein [Deltaproteobacteria bacterium]|nr:ATP-binding protein [Deltaproteobacteria bacterium]